MPFSVRKPSFVAASILIQFLYQIGTPSEPPTIFLPRTGSPATHGLPEPVGRGRQRLPGLVLPARICYAGAPWQRGMPVTENGQGIIFMSYYPDAVCLAARGGSPGFRNRAQIF